MSGAEALAIIGLVSNIISFVDYGKRIMERLEDFQCEVEEVPKTFRDIKTQLPLLLDSLNKTKEQAEAGMVDKDTQTALIPVVDGCREQLKELDSTLVKTLPSKADSPWQVKLKAFSSVHQEKKVKGIVDTLHGYVQTLTNYQVTRVGGLDLKNYLHETRSRSPRPENRKLFLVPFERDCGYIDRAGIIAEVDGRLKTSRRVSLAGIGGVGKSQLAIEYCYRYHEHNPAANIFWVHASNLPSLDQGYKYIARKLSLPGWDELDQNTFQTVCDWLSDIEHGPWLMVLDSADDLDLFFPRPAKNGQNTDRPQITRFIPRSSVGTVIITTRDKRVAERLTDRQKPIPVLPMNNAEAQDLLRSKLPEEIGMDENEAADLVDALGNLPLAISQAAAFITENSMEVSQYLEAFRSDVSQVQDLLSEDLGDHRRYADSESSVFSTWKLSFDQITKQQPRAADILSLMAVLDRNAIPKSLLIRNNERPMDFTMALGTLQAFSLIVVEKVVAGRDTKFALHRLVQLSTRRWLELKDALIKWEETALQVISDHFPPGEYENWNQCEALSPHAQVVIQYEFKSNQNLLSRAQLLHNLARFDLRQSRYSLAYDRFSEIISVRKDLLGPDNLDTISSTSSLGEVLFHQSKYPDAERTLRVSLAVREKTLGMKHPETILNLGHLAEIIRGQGRYSEAESLYRCALAGKEDDLREDLIAMKNMDNLGSVLRDAERLDQAEKCVRLAFTAREKVTGPDSLVTLGSVSHLALILRLRGCLDDAETMNKHALAGFEKTLGREHHFTLRSLDDLAVVFRCQGKLELAEEQNRRALGGFSKVLGMTHRRTLASRKHLALILQLRGRYTESATLLKTVLQIQEKTFGHDAPQTLQSLYDLEHVQRKCEEHAKNEMQKLSLTDK